MRRAVDKMIKDNKKAGFTVQLTSMVDMFTILIVFLLKSQSTSAVHIAPQKGLDIPISESRAEPQEEALKLVVSSEGIFLEDQMIVEIKDGKLASGSTDAADPDFIRPLFEELDKQANKTHNIAEKNEEVKFDGKVIMQADKTMPYSLLKKIMYTSSIAGYADFKMATISTE